MQNFTPNSIAATPTAPKTLNFGTNTAFGSLAPQTPQGFSLPKSNPTNLSNQNSILATPNATSATNPAQNTQKMGLFGAQKQKGQDALNNMLNAKSADELQKPKYIMGAGLGNYRAQKAAYATQAQELGISPQHTPAQKGANSLNIAQNALAGIDSAANLVNAGMSYANMAKQWKMMDNAWRAAEQQRQIENQRYEKRENERIQARDDAKDAQKAVFGNRKWHDAQPQSEPQDEPQGEPQNLPQGEQENEQEKNAFERD